ncbi:hypothetical protein JCM8097_006635 [Rhodosporidiobolus ruineniae]
MSSSPPPLEYPTWVVKTAQAVEKILRVLPTPLRFAFLALVYSVNWLLALVLGTLSLYHLVRLTGLWTAMTTLLECVFAAWLQRGVEIPPSERSSFALQIELHDSIDSLIAGSSAVQAAQKPTSDQEAFVALMQPFYQHFVQVLHLPHGEAVQALAFIKSEHGLNPPPQHADTPSALHANLRALFVGHVLLELV